MLVSKTNRIHEEVERTVLWLWSTKVSVCEEMMGKLPEKRVSWLRKRDNFYGNIYSCTITVLEVWDIRTLFCYYNPHELAVLSDDEDSCCHQDYD